MLAPLVVFWLASPPAHPDHQLEIAEWAAEHGFRPVAAAPTPRPAYDGAVVREIETLLEEARTLPPGSTGSFERLEQLLGEHAELPQAGWWMAERYALEAQYRAQSTERDVSAELDLARRGSDIEGVRAAAVGAAATSALDVTRRHEALQLSELRPRDELLVDGNSVASGTEVSPGRHHVQLFRAQRRVWADWVELGSPPLLRVLDPTPACSELDLWGTGRGAQGPTAAPGVRCAAWAVASPRGDGVELALCRGSRCGAWERRDRTGGSGTLGDSAASSPNERLPSWVSWGALGIGAAASAALVLWQAGVFDRPAPATEFVFTGPTAAALRF